MKTRWERYHDNIKQKKRWQGIGMHTHRLKGFNLPTHDEMTLMNKLNIIYDIDPPIRSVILELNAVGMKTMGSCAGHNKRSRGFITFNEKTYNENLAVDILQRHGLKRIKIERPGWVYIGAEKLYAAFYAMTFSPTDARVGGYRHGRGPHVPKKLIKMVNKQHYQKI